MRTSLVYVVLSLVLLLVQQVNVYDAGFLSYSDWYFVILLVVLLVKDWIGIVLYLLLHRLGRLSDRVASIVHNHGLSKGIINTVFYASCTLHAYWMNRSSTFWLLFFVNINMLGILKLLGISIRKSGKVSRSENNYIANIVALYAINIPVNEFIITDKLSSFALIDNITVVHQYFHGYRLFLLSIAVSVVQAIYMSILVSMIPLLYVRPDVLYFPSSCYALVAFNSIFLFLLYLFFQVLCHRGLLLLDSKTQSSGSDYVTNLIKSIWSYEQTSMSKSCILHYLLLMMVMMLVVEVVILLVFGLRRKSFLLLCFVKLGTISLLRVALNRFE